MICRDPEEEAEEAALVEDHAAVDSAEAAAVLAEDPEVALADLIAEDSTADRSLAADSTDRAVTMGTDTAADVLGGCWEC